MGKIYYLMGKSSSGKDTMFKKLIEDKELALKTIVGYTTRPMREGETEGIEYHFVDEDTMKSLENEGRVIERRSYGTVHGVWNYFTVDDGERLQRALDRERTQDKPRYAEMCRRFLADEKDFSEENIARCGINKRYENDDLGKCFEEIKNVILNV